MPKVVELSDVGINQAALNARPPLLTPPIPTTTPYAKVLYYDDVRRVWGINIRYAIICLRRRLVSLAPALVSTINTVVQWGEFFAIDASEIIYYVRSNTDTRVGYYDGKNTIIEAAGPGAVVTRNSPQIIGALKTFAAGAVVGNSLTVAGNFSAAGFTLDCGKYEGAPVSTLPTPATPVATVSPYSVSLAWSSPGTPNVRYIIEASELGLDTGSGTPTGSANWTSVVYIPPTGSSSYSIAGLRPGVYYTFRIKAIGPNCNTAYSAASTPVLIKNY